MTTTQATKIVIVSGQEFSVPADTDNEAIRQQLAGMGFADVAAATIQKGKRTVDGQELETIEFIKKAGTKGLDGVELAALLARVPPSKAPGRRNGGDELLYRLINGELTIAEALADNGDMIDNTLIAAREYSPRQSQGAQLCSLSDRLSAVPAAADCAW
jgi:hypothetical protein